MTLLKEIKIALKNIVLCGGTNSTKEPYKTNLLKKYAKKHGLIYRDIKLKEPKQTNLLVYPNRILKK